MRGIPRPISTIDTIIDAAGASRISVRSSSARIGGFRQDRAGRRARRRPGARRLRRRSIRSGSASWSRCRSPDRRRSVWRGSRAWWGWRAVGVSIAGAGGSSIRTERARRRAVGAPDPERLVPEQCSDRLAGPHGDAPRHAFRVEGKRDPASPIDRDAAGVAAQGGGVQEKFPVKKTIICLII